MSNTSSPGGFEPPAYPYDRLVPIAEAAAASFEQVYDLSVGTPIDAPSPAVIAALCGDSSLARTYPPSLGRAEVRAAFSAWFFERLGVDVGADRIGLTIGSKEFVASAPHVLRLRRPDLDTVLYPEISYPSYAMGATLAGCRSVGVPARPDGSMDLDAIDEDDRRRAVCLWINSPSNPTGHLDDLAAAARFAVEHDVTVLSDECYAEFTWDAADRGRADDDGRPPGDSILRYTQDNVLAIHSLSKRSNLAGVRVGCYGGDPELVRYFSEVRKHAGLMVAGPAQAAAVAALADQAAADEQRERYRRRLAALASALAAIGIDAPLPAGAFYLWCSAPARDGWALARHCAETLGIITSPGEFYGPAGRNFLRVAAVCDDAAVETIAQRAIEASGRIPAASDGGPQ